MYKRWIETYNIKPRIAIYSYNFGNYRNELGIIDNFKYYPEFDYYYFTDNNDIKSDIWNVIYVPLQPKTEFMDSNRMTTKYYKFKYLHPVLRDYDYIIHIDSGRVRYLSTLSYQVITDVINNNPDTLFFGTKHPFLNNIFEEGEQVIKSGLDNKSKVLGWSKKLKDEKFMQTIPHMELCLFMFKNEPEVLDIFSKVYDKLIEEQLRRDQFIFIYVLQKYNFTNLKVLDIFSKLQ